MVAWKVSLPDLLAASRLPFLSASALTSVVAIAWCGAYGEIDHWGYALAAVCGVVLVHLAANTANDTCDWEESDAHNLYAGPFSGGSRCRLGARLTRGHFALLSGFYLLLAAILGGVLAAHGRPHVLTLGAVGALGGISYSAPPLRLVNRGLGELILLLLFGPLTTAGTGYVVEGILRLEHVVIGLPMGFFIANILWINQFPDYQADQRAHKANWVVRLGLPKARWGYPLLVLGGQLSVVLLVVANLFPLQSLLLVALTPLAVGPMRTLWAHYDHPFGLLPAQAATIRFQIIAGLLLVLTLVRISFWTS